MPQATDELRAKWSDSEGRPSDEKATKHLMAAGFTFFQGTIYPPPGYTAARDPECESAVDFMCDEWDFAYIDKPLALPDTRR